MKLSTFRKVIFWAFVVLYFIVAPLITLHALGFVYDPASRSFIKTGIVSIATEPKQANVFLNGQRNPDKTPTAISGLRPGFYSLQISREGYQDWTRKIEVRQEEVTRNEHILLIPNKLQLSNPVIFPVEAFVPAENNKYLFLIHRAGKKAIILAYDIKKRKTYPMAEYEADTGRIDSIEITVSDDENRALFGFTNGLQTEYAVSMISDEALPAFLSKLVPDPVNNVRFHPNDSTKLFYLIGNQINLLDLQSRSIKTGIAEQILSFEIMEDKIYCFDVNLNLLSVDLDGKRVINLLPNKALKKFLFGEDNFTPHLTAMTEKGTVFWLSKSGKLLTNRLPYFIDEDVKSIALAPDVEQLVYWKGKELWLLDLQTTGKRDSFFEEGPQKRMIWKSDKRIIFAQIIRQGKYVIAATNRTIELIEIDPLSEKLVPSWTISEHSSSEKLSIHLDEGSGKLYWTGCRPEERLKFCESGLIEPSLFPFSIKLKKHYHSPAHVSLD